MSDDVYGIQPDPPRGDKGKQGDQGKPAGDDRPDNIQRLPSYPGSDRPNYDFRPSDEQISGGGGGGGMSSTAIGWLIFFLIFGVGNLILYSTTGIFFIPIPRR